MQLNERTFEVDEIVCRRVNNLGSEEYLVYWKGFDISSATWEPSSNLISCADIVQQFQRKASPIPGANLFSLECIEKTKTVHLKMLMNRKRGTKRRKNVCDDMPEQENDKTKIENGCKYSAEDALITKENRKKLRESERLIRDTLLHEAKSFKPRNGLSNHVNDLINSYDKNNFNNSPLVSSLVKKNTYSRNYKDSSIKDHILHTVKKGYMEITLNNTARHNLLNIAMLECLCDCLQKAKKSSDVKAIVLTNNGDYFCSGVDYTDLMHCTDDKEYKMLVNDIITSLRSFLDIYLYFSKPIICAINGTVLELGISLIIAADYAYSSSKSHYDIMFGKLELTPVGGLTKLLPLLVGPSVTKTMIHSGRFSAVSAYERGLVLEMFGVNSFEEDISKKVKEIFSISPRILENTKKLLDETRNENLDKVLEEELTSYNQCLLHKDCKRKIKDEWTTLINLYGGI